MQPNFTLDWVEHVWKLEVVIFVGIILQFVLHYFRHKNLAFDFKTGSWLWIPVYLALSGIISYLGVYGGGLNIIASGPDFWLYLVHLH